jgi:hypothetical protein
MAAFLRINQSLRINLSNIVAVQGPDSTDTITVICTAPAPDLRLHGAEAAAFVEFLDGIGEKLYVPASCTGKAEPTNAETA